MIPSSSNYCMQESGPMKIWQIGHMMHIIVKEIVNHPLIFDLIFRSTNLVLNVSSSNKWIPPVNNLHFYLHADYFIFIDLTQLTNNGHTGQLYLFISIKNFSLSLAQLHINGIYIVKNIAPCSGDFIVEQVHFHWGHSNNNTNGSEHLLETQSYPLEVLINNDVQIFKITFYLDAYR
jgi:hypothetical protein